jgi:hypothetical protein
LSSRKSLSIEYFILDASMQVFNGTSNMLKNQNNSYLVNSNDLRQTTPLKPRHSSNSNSSVSTTASLVESSQNFVRKSNRNSLEPIVKHSSPRTKLTEERKNTISLWSTKK